MTGAASTRAASPRAAELVAIVAPLEEELAALLPGTASRRRIRGGALAAWRGRLEDTEVVLAATGDGPRRAGRGVRELLDAHPVARLIVVGVAGGLSPDLEPGAVVVAARVLDGRSPAPGPDPDGVRLAGDGGAAPATVLTSRRLLCTAAEKENARQALPFAGSAVVDVESAAYARAAAERGVPYVVLRAVCDAAGEALPFDMNGCADEDGSIVRSKVLRYALLHPAVIGSLWDLRQRVRRCSGRLAPVVGAVLRGLPARDPGRLAAEAGEGR